jgi:CBS domain-containing protein
MALRRPPRTVGHTPTRPPEETTVPTYAPSFASYTVLNAMQLGLIECPPEADLATVARLMAENRIHCVIVSGIERHDRRGEQLDWGIVSDLDLMAGLRPECADATAGELAASDVVIADPGDSLEHAAQLMAEHDTTHLVVVSASTGRPVGIVSTLDVARAMAAG